ncbi:hypothetical protein CLU79DRAFT_742322 [Phycomyces nitens]|nr:hypothetical protein CLU79DRAFT_742322 [Phycomyces nitens]
MASAFFYGTLMLDSILLGVLCGSQATSDVKQKKKESLQLVPATLLGHRRFALKELPYPGVIVTNPEDQINGRLCCGLSAQDVMRLDAFEGSEYDRCTAVALVDGERVPCQVYIWIGGNEHLETYDWETDDFLKNIPKNWI